MPLRLGQEIQEVSRSGGRLALNLSGSPLSAKALRDLLERKVRSLGTGLIPPKLENATVTERDELALADSQFLRGRIDPLARTLEFGINAQRSFVDHAMALSVCPFRTPFFVHKHRGEAQGFEDLP